MTCLFENTVTPDFEALKDCLLRRRTPARVHFMEFYRDQPIDAQIIERFDLARNLDSNHPFHWYQREIALNRFLGYDLLKLPQGLKFEFQHSSADDSAERSRDKVAAGPIQTWADFERYPWPKVADLDLAPLDWLEKAMPAGMKGYAVTPVGFYKLLLGYESICYLLYDDPELIKAVCRKLTELYRDFARTLCQYSCVGALWGSDDMGFKTQTFLPPGFLRESVLPMHAAMAQAAHDAGKLYILHSCGNLAEIMPDLIDEVKIDAKHSFEDAILPVTDAKRLYGDKVALIGGIDVDFLCRADEMALRRRVRQTLEVCLPGGGYCLGSGNSIADYVPVEQYLIMLDEGRKFA